MSSESFLYSLPTLEDILNRKTLPPVCLYNFYIVMRDKFELDDLLDFYLDVKHHEVLWRRYAKSLLKEQAAVPQMADQTLKRQKKNNAIIPVGMLKSTSHFSNHHHPEQQYPFTNEMERSASASTSELSSLLSDSGTTYYSLKNSEADQRLSEGLQYTKPSLLFTEQQQYNEDDQPITKYLDITACVSDDISFINTPLATQQQQRLYHHQQNMNQISQPMINSIENNRGSVFQHFLPNNSSMTTMKRFADDDNVISTNKNYRHQATLLEQLSASTERIVLTYFLNGSEKNLNDILPTYIRANVIERYVHPNGKIRIDPMLFADAKYAAFLYMERWAYPSFMRLKVWGNITDRQRYYRLVFGIICLTIGLSMSFSFIFLGYSPWGKRFWILLPFLFAIYQLLVFITRLDPLLAIVFNLSETTVFHFNKISQPQVKSILHARAIWLLLFSSVISVVLTIIFCAIPPQRL
ncbi:hypothetical protein BDF20DRAFT_1000239 [Mycotypha africana]|uniref:uncharacterized protein n=1 Tax=Mycotypha africana TaxID=64632 RepID=UPI0023011A77|nr:uncharacterized protein BDF20DRAFT_1000239 [Mycotypha africana]KAI8982242.1 hypothetical protein BDF20DRAFT_1000239 [Mycotypha africana]